MRRLQQRPTATTAAPRPPVVADLGATLVEVIVALGIVLVLLSAAASAFIGSVNGQRTAEATDQATQLANDQIERIRQLPWTKAVIDPTATTTRACTDPMVLAASQQVCRARTFTVATSLTWDGGSQPVTPATATSGYASKRITVAVSWQQGNRTRTVTSGTLRAPTLAERIPPGLQGSTVNTCDVPAPASGPAIFCRLWVTHGQVLAQDPALRVSRDIVLRATTTTRATAVTAQVPGKGSVTLTGDPTGRSWALTLPAGTSLTGPGTPLGADPVRFAATTVSGNAQADYRDARWRVALPAAAALEVRPPVGTWADPLRLLVSGDARTFTGTETTSTHLCIDPSGATWRNQALVFETTNVDDMDGDQGDPARGRPADTHPTVTVTGVVDDNGTLTTAVLPPSDVTHPTDADSASAPAYSGSTDGIAGGYVGARQTAAGTLNTLRFAALVPARTLLQASGAPAPSTVTMTMTVSRPGDGLSVSQPVQVPVATAAAASDCPAGPA